MCLIAINIFDKKNITYIKLTHFLLNLFLAIIFLSALYLLISLLNNFILIINLHSRTAIKNNNTIAPSFQILGVFVEI